MRRSSMRHWPGSVRSQRLEGIAVVVGIFQGRPSQKVVLQADKRAHRAKEEEKRESAHSTSGIQPSMYCVLTAQ